MKKWGLLVLIIGFGGGIPSLGHANAKQLVDGCKALSEMEEAARAAPNFVRPEDEGAYIASAGYCTGYLSGYIAGHSSALAKGKAYCLPEEVSISQIARVLTKRLETSPEFEHMPEISFVLGVLSGTWPCHDGNNVEVPSAVP